MRRSIFLLLVFLLLITPVFGVVVTIEKTPLNTSEPTPTIIVTFNETVNLTSYNFTKNGISYQLKNVTSDNKLFNFTPENPLYKGTYLLRIKAEDQVKNAIVVNQPINVNVPYMDIRITAPPRGVSSTPDFGITVWSEKTSMCKYSLSTTNPVYVYEFIETTPSQNHNKPTFSADHSSLFDLSPTDKDMYGRWIGLECRDTVGGTHYKDLYTGYDTSPPEINITFNPEVINDVRRPYTILNVTTSDRTICTYTEDGNLKQFSGYNTSDFYAYYNKHGAILNFSYLVEQSLLDERIINYDINCENLAGLNGETKNFTLRINFRESLTITQQEPPQYTNKQNPITIKVKTNKVAACKDKNDNGLQTTDGFIHTKQQSFGEGEYTYEVICDEATSRARKNLTFTLDRTPPANLTITVDRDPSCSSTISGRFTATDTNFDYFNYTIEDLSGNNLAKGTTGSVFSKTIDLGSLQNASPNYRVNLVAYDKAGNAAQTNAQFTATSTSGVRCDNENPTTDITTSTKTGGIEVMVLCEDHGGSGCKDRFQYGKANTTASCVYTKGEYLGTGILVDQDLYFCWAVFDQNNNNANRTEFIEYSAYPSHCYDAEQNGDETGLNCGGSCPPCNITEHCSNGVQDSQLGETGVDCGGTCLACEDLGGCTTNSDCQSHNCQNNTCIPATCDDNILNQNETGTDCGGPNCAPCSGPKKDIELIQPKNGVSKTQVFDLVVKTKESASCGYAWTDLPGGLEAYNPMIPGQNNLHTKNSFKHEGVAGVEYAIYIKCKLEIDHSYIKGAFNLSWDPTPPKITSITLDRGDGKNPPTIVDYPLSTNIIVKTDDKARCKYSESETTPYGMMSKFSNFNYELFNFENKQLFGGLQDQKTYKYYFQCENTVGDTSQKEMIEFKVNTSAASEIKVITPEVKSKNTNFKFKIQLNRAATSCKYENTQPATTTMNKLDDKNFESAAATLSEGRYSYFFTCLTPSKGPITEEYQFVIDTTPPTTPIVDDGTRFSSITQLGAKWESTDTLSDITQYSYSIGTNKGDTNVNGWTNTTNNRATATGLSLLNNTVYYWNVKAMNELGLWSMIGFSDGVKVIIDNPATAHCADGIFNYDEERTDCGGKDCEACGPLPSHCTNNIKDFNETDTDCGGECNPCGQNKYCNTNSDCSSRNCKEGMCVAATCSDNILNQNETGTDCGGECLACPKNSHCTNKLRDADEERTDCGGKDCEACGPLPSHCTNNIKDFNETDTDCGGECNPCGQNKYCNTNSDCSSRNCIDHVCMNSLCYDDIQNHDETDIDCGGTCTPCDTGSDCKKNADCKTNNCKKNVCEDNPTTDSDDDGMPDYWEDKYGLDPYDPTDADEDTDEDGYTNLQEYLAGTDPTDPNDHPIDSDEDGMPDYWEELYGLNPNDATDADEDLDGDGYTNLEEYHAGTDPTVPSINPTKSNSAAWILLLIGLVMIISGASYLLVKKKLGVTIQQHEPIIEESDFTKKINEEKKKTIATASNVFRQRAQEKKEKRKELVNMFEEEKIQVKKPGQKTQEPEKEKKTQPKKPKKDYIDISELGEEEPSEEEEKNAFEKLEEIEKEKTQKKPTTAKEKAEGDKKTQETQDIFKELAEMAGTSHDEIKKKVEKNEFSSENIKSVFEKVKTKDKIDPNVFKNILSHLLEKGHLSKQNVAEVLFGYYDRKLITKEEISDILKELDLVRK